MISVAEALEHLFALVSPLDIETVPIRQSAGRVLAEPISARRDQPPFATATMDGYAVRTRDVMPSARLQVIGEAAAGHAGVGTVGPGQAMRIFTGAPVPDGADRVLIQEDTTRDDDTVTVSETPDGAAYIRPAAADFRAGDTLSSPRRLGANDLVLAAAMNLPALPCTRKPDVALIATGDELVMPGETPGPDQIIASNALGLAALLQAEGVIPRLLPIARDTKGSLSTAFDLAQGADLIVTIGGASVGEHDLVQAVAHDRGMDPAFYKVAMRPGKPLMAGRMGGVPMIGLPGNPVSAIVCGHVFLLPTLRVMLGLSAAPAERHSAELAEDLGPNGPREHYVRARVESGRIRAFSRQDSGLMGVLADANALLVRPPDVGPALAGTQVSYLPI